MQQHVWSNLTLSSCKMSVSLCYKAYETMARGLKKSFQVLMRGIEREAFQNDYY